MLSRPINSHSQHIDLATLRSTSAVRHPCVELAHASASASAEGKVRAQHKRRLPRGGLKYDPLFSSRLLGAARAVAL